MIPSFLSWVLFFLTGSSVSQLCHGTASFLVSWSKSVSPRAGRGASPSSPRAAPTSAAGSFEMKYLEMRSLTVCPRHARSLASLCPGFCPLLPSSLWRGSPRVSTGPHQLFFPIRTCSFQVSWGYPAGARGEPGVPEEVDTALVREDLEEAQAWWAEVRASGLALLYNSNLLCVYSVSFPSFDALLICHFCSALRYLTVPPPFLVTHLIWPLAPPCSAPQHWVSFNMSWDVRISLHFP